MGENDGWAREGRGSLGNGPATPDQRGRGSGGRHRGNDAAVDEKRPVVGVGVVGFRIQWLLFIA